MLRKIMAGGGSQYRYDKMDRLNLVFISIKDSLISITLYDYDSVGKRTEINIFSSLSWMSEFFFGIIFR